MKIKKLYKCGRNTYVYEITGTKGEVAHVAKNAKLVIEDTNGFSNDIWQCDCDMTKAKWEDAIDTLTDNLQSIYDFLEREECEGFITPSQQYQLGDVINMLRNIDIVLKER